MATMSSNPAGEDAASDVVGSDLRSVAERAAQRNAERAAAANERLRAEREDRVEKAAREFLAARTEHLPELLRQAAEDGQFEHQVWQQELGHFPHGGEEVDGILRGMKYVANWLKDRGIKADLHDDGGTSEPDYGFIRLVWLKASWS